ncbi:MAG: dockerin type I repeat-containing protein [Phycisphaerae bacterium]|nr:dockerin type I repeat-containing protein [Phycisphaerae bacterium]
MPLRSDTTRLLASLVAATLAGLASAAPPANDQCVNSAPISGAGPVAFDLTEATISGNGIVARQCDGPVLGIQHDVWFCWTSTCNGFVEFSTCGGTQVDTRIRIYDGCTCPGDIANPICCSDDDCGLQTRVVCDAVCGHTYLIQIGTKPGTPGGPGTLTITCLEETCGSSGGGGTPPASCDCCGARPEIVNAPPAPFVPFVQGAVAAVTNSPSGPNDPPVYLIEIGNPGAAPLGSNWNAAQRYSHPSWTTSKLGQVFGVTIDGSGNVFVGHTSCYGNIGGDILGSLGGAGSIYRLDGATGASTELIRLPNAIDPVIAAGNPNEAYPGLGNLSFDCGTGRLFAANLEDGRIYSIDPSGGPSKVKSTFDIATGSITGALPNIALGEPGDAPGWVPLGERPYAVKASGGRLYYSVWAGSIVQNPPGGFFSGGVNTIRSVALDGSGNFVPGSDQLEITLPPFQNFGGSCPVVDISFDDECCMIVAERGLDEIVTYAHAARVMKYCFDQAAGATWGAPFVYQIGNPNICFYTNLNSATGGAAVDPSTGLLWATGDYLGSAPCGTPYIYGLQGQPITGALPASSVLVDLDAFFGAPQKYYVGSLDITCVEPPCATLDTEEILCRENGSYSWTFTLTNTSGSTASVLILPDPSITPNVIPFNPPLTNGATSAPITVTINGQQPGSEFCFDLILGDVKGNECCHLTPCIELPDCECAQTSHVQLQATSTPGVFSLTFDITNLEAWNMGHVVLFPSGTTGSLSPSLFNFAGVPTYGTQTIGPVTVTSGMSPGDVFCITIGQHSVNWLQCCFIELCVTVPDPAASCLPADLNCDGHVNAADLAILLGAWGSQGPGDLNADGTVNANDLAILLGAWGS